MHSLNVIRTQNAAADLAHANAVRKASGHIDPSEIAQQEALQKLHDKQAAERLARQSALIAKGEAIAA